MKKLEFDFNNEWIKVPEAQAKFDEWYKQIENAPVVYKEKSKGPHPRWGWICEEYTHTARLIDIQEIKPKCEKHIAKFDRQQNTYFCDSCGCELIVEFKEKK